MMHLQRTIWVNALRVAPVARLEYAAVSATNPRFNGRRFSRLWARHVGSHHRDPETGRLVLFHSEANPRPRLVRLLKWALERDPRNIGSVLAAVDARDGTRPLLRKAA